MIKFKIVIKKLSQNGSLKIRKSLSCGKKKETAKLCIFGVPKKWPDQARKTRVPNTPKDETTPNPERFVSHTCVSHTFHTNLPLLGETPRLFRSTMERSIHRRCPRNDATQRNISIFGTSTAWGAFAATHTHVAAAAPQAVSCRFAPTVFSSCVAVSVPSKPLGGCVPARKMPKCTTETPIVADPCQTP